MSYISISDLNKRKVFEVDENNLILRDSSFRQKKIFSLTDDPSQDSKNLFTKIDLISILTCDDHFDVPGNPCK